MFDSTHFIGWGMIHRSAAAIAALLVSAAPIGQAAAQYYSAPPPVYRGSPPPSAYDYGPPPPGGYFGDDDDGGPVVRRPPGLSQGPGQPNRILPYPEEADVNAPPAPAFAAPDGRPGPGAQGQQPDQQLGHQLGSGSASVDGPDVIRPPGSIGAAPAAVPQANVP